MGGTVKGDFLSVRIKIGIPAQWEKQATQTFTFSNMPHEWRVSCGDGIHVPDHTSPLTLRRFFFSLWEGLVFDHLKQRIK